MINVREGVDVFVHATVEAHVIVQVKALGARESVPLSKQGKEHRAVVIEQSLVQGLVAVGPGGFHAVLFSAAFQLAMPQHGQARQGGLQGGSELGLQFRKNNSHQTFCT